MLPPKTPPPVGAAIERVLSLDRLDELYDRVRSEPDGGFCANLLSALNVQVRVSEADRRRIPREGPVVAVANHPFGFIEGIILGSLLPSLRPDVKIMANFILASVPELRKVVIPVDPFGGEQSVRANLRGLKESLEWLERGGMLVIFPAGEVAHLDVRRRAVTDPEWSHSIARLLRKTKATALPIYFSGTNGPLFQLAGLIHPRLRTALLPHEFLNKHGQTVELRVGSPVPCKRLATLQNDEEAMDYLRSRTFLLENRQREKAAPSARTKNAGRPIVPAIPAATLDREIAALPSHTSLVESGEFQVLLVTAHQAPNVLREIGRLRETTFRAAGEGTGQPLDLDRFDEHYLHLFLWNRATREIAGAYRLGQTDRLGLDGLYTRTLFSYGRAFLERLGPALELGRSFVIGEYQKGYQPLLLLWKGIGRYVAANPRYKVLFGPVSISNDYQPASRQIMVDFLRMHEQQPDLAKLVRPRRPFKSREVPGWGRTAQWDLEDLASVIGDIESDQKGVPVLLRQYLKVGGKLVAFNVDPEFSDALDGLIVVDLKATSPKMLERYMGKEGAAALAASA
ncbi:MAG: GNAT family N-acyltransferase [Bryobacteraceae bacterium]|nr:GNAT family N-acyltransferase [Bryobacteraceae bacterium]